jgi:hypothetical protein
MQECLQLLTSILLMVVRPPASPFKAEEESETHLFATPRIVGILAQVSLLQSVPIKEHTPNATMNLQEENGGSLASMPSVLPVACTLVGTIARETPSSRVELTEVGEGCAKRRARRNERVAADNGEQSGSECLVPHPRKIDL